ncbi:hypothetical protein FNL55_01355 [Tardiphaga sp. vice352]|nr:dihydrofolate reductase family protein [Tardiphaga sp.]QDM14752.1 hypothetical protein FNL53_01360 [Tardiphaga sp. vice278]QDM24931.1 hypothetical protein FNL56_01260 [Tardiphaga sp. vice304]QDM30141.1 hypothetical protein FNL55_01355 [Tardiphaga sp. vice352]
MPAGSTDSTRCRHRPPRPAFVAVLGNAVSVAYLAELADDGASYIVSEHKAIDLPAALEGLGRELGIKRPALEGGRSISCSFFAADLIDEFCVIVAPALDARSGNMPIVAFCDAGLAGKAELSLISCERLEHGAVHLRYTVTPGQPRL